MTEYKLDFVPSERVTEDDKKNNRKSLNRHLQHTLMLLVKDKQGWGLPSIPLGDKESLRQVWTCLVANSLR